MWGGSSRGKLFADGAAYDPGSDRWRPLSAAPLGGRTSHTAVWIGEEMLVWGGCCERRGAEFGDGAAYDPAADTWRPLPPAPIEARRGHTAVWTGRHMLVWGGAVFERAFADGATYSPGRDRWSRLPDAPVEPRYSHSAVWTGTQMIVWGGATLEPATLNDGAALGRGWSRVSPSGPARSAHSTVWSGTEMLLWGGCCANAGRELGGGSAYEPTSGTWRDLPESGLDPRVEHVALPANGRMLIWGGVNSERRFADGALFEPLQDAWTPLTPAPLEPRFGAAGVWTGNMFLVWGGCCDAEQRSFANGAALPVATGRPLPAPEGTPTETATPGLEPEDTDIGFGALIALFGLILLAALVASARALRKRSGR